MTRFDGIQFGLASAEDESARLPALLLEGYWDVGGIVEKAKTGHEYLFLGYKGSGKSSLAEHLKLLTSHDFFPSIVNLADFPYTSFKKIVSGDADPDAKYPTAWSWLLLLRILGSLRSDQGSPTLADPHFVAVTKKLEEMGLLKTDNLNKLVVQSIKNSFRAQIPALLEIAAEETYSGADLQMLTVVELLKGLVVNFQTNNKHLLIIDGLDDVLNTKSVQYQSLSSLVFQVNRLNQEFSQSNPSIKILLLCRTELFEKLPNPNKNKIRQNSSEYLEWYNAGEDNSEPNLWRLVNLRASISDQNISDIRRDYLNIQINHGDAEDFLIRLTRHTPRDLIQLLNCIQKCTSGEKPTRDEVMVGARNYSYNYFLPEIKDELSGYHTPNDIELVFQLLGSIRKRDFYITEVNAALKARTAKLEEPLDSILTSLFECSAIGNVQNRSGGNSFYTFRYRNRHSSFNTSERIILHSGLWKAMNLI